MRSRFAPLVPFALIALLSACAGQQLQPEPAQPSVSARGSASTEIDFDAIFAPVHAEQASPGELHADGGYQLPQLADSVIELGFSLMGTPYRYGGTSAKTGFDCSGFVNFVFRKEAGLELPRSTRELINLDAPLVKRDELEPGDVVFFNNRGRGRVSHAGIYIGDDRFIHSASRRSGGVRVDSLDDKYWRSSYLEAKRVLALAPDLPSATVHR
ncbi:MULTISPECIES: C40 family peptidase [Stutzerimonas]|jgi:cell wall-associated NlpC family hydrolase|uniref:Cell wall-associated hydrolase, NlpC family n=1 Tax=Stutzerimonas balearica DSM 6083 TaxID=1123016 RepID=A0A8D3XZR1_9GAMM|nr:C40 family peptidase [Stutzerimonas balearica]KIL05026.1 peptidase P60 [Stutzerimonas stutzeri]AJE14739.1 peptidase P60 [Stutzerimonas balearica DSM 6083]MCZ4128114.1 C40 family peptidase [Stutzerimonas balearica]OMG66202.1 peptidase P60 [Stutzerimonas balearica]QIJ01681.1 peptidoglycan endopeptidase [Stutzerimonas balearica]